MQDMAIRQTAMIIVIAMIAVAICILIVQKQRNINLRFNVMLGIYASITILTLVLYALAQPTQMQLWTVIIGLPMIPYAFDVRQSYLYAYSSIAVGVLWVLLCIAVYPHVLYALWFLLGLGVAARTFLLFKKRKKNKTTKLTVVTPAD